MDAIDIISMIVTISIGAFGGVAFTRWRFWRRIAARRAERIETQRAIIDDQAALISLLTRGKAVKA